MTRPRPRKPVRFDVAYAPETGQKRPWELHSVFDCGRRRFLGSFKTEAAANKRRERAEALFDL
jgi:hypothetical protein